MKQYYDEEKSYRNDQHNDTPINDAMEYMNKIQCMPMKRVNMKSLPLPIRVIGYVMFGGLMIFFIAFILFGYVF